MTAVADARIGERCTYTQRKARPAHHGHRDRNRGNSNGFKGPPPIHLLRLDRLLHLLKLRTRTQLVMVLMAIIVVVVIQDTGATEHRGALNGHSLCKGSHKHERLDTISHGGGTQGAGVQDSGFFRIREFFAEMCGNRMCTRFYCTLGDLGALTRTAVGMMIPIAIFTGRSLLGNCGETRR